jgi:hypothetical protein
MTTPLGKKYVRKLWIDSAGMSRDYVSCFIEAAGRESASAAHSLGNPFKTSKR